MKRPIGAAAISAVRASLTSNHQVRRVVCAGSRVDSGWRRTRPFSGFLRRDVNLANASRQDIGKSRARFGNGRWIRRRSCRTDGRFAQTFGEQNPDNNSQHARSPVA
jgi:hypothetical protein